MARCCQNVVTPKIIKAGKVQIGDKIQLDDITSMPEPRIVAPTTNYPVEAKVESTEPMAETLHVSEPSQSIDEEKIPTAEAEIAKKYELPLTNDLESFEEPSALNHASTQSTGTKILNYDQMTDYVQSSGSSSDNNAQGYKVPHTPLTKTGHQEVVDYNSIQTFSGFLKTQMGRYMRIEQLIGTTTIDDKFGFLVGTGSDYIILQEITTGNILLIDFSTIKSVYIYYSKPVYPDIAPQ